jgi:HPt (histidine-containing phosphotransfer) domain-containing protein
VDKKNNPESPYTVQVDPLIAPLVPGYLKSRGEDVQRIAGLLAAKDFAALRKLGHNMRGSAGAYGLAPLSAIGTRIESAAVASDGAAIGAAVEEMGRFLQNVKVT